MPHDAEPASLTLNIASHALLEAMVRDPVSALAGVASVPPDSVIHLREISALSLIFYQASKARPPWLGYLAIDTASRLVVGSCGFKGNPNDSGEVEIAYATFAPHEGRGVACFMAEQLCRIAIDEPGVKTILAHTLPETNASGRVLLKNGFEKIGEVVDPDDGPVWRWERPACSRSAAQIQ
jgi:RimJ/RimL family protein N-acetyltransferase